jgi:hypothetical protein
MIQNKTSGNTGNKEELISDVQTELTQPVFSSGKSCTVTNYNAGYDVQLVSSTPEGGSSNCRHRPAHVRPLTSPAILAAYSQSLRTIFSHAIRIITPNILCDSSKPSGNYTYRLL